MHIACRKVNADLSVSEAPPASFGSALPASYVVPPGNFSCNPPPGVTGQPAWADSFFTLTPGLHFFINPEISGFASQYRLCSYHSTHPQFDLVSLLEGISRWHVFGDADSSKTINDLWGISWTSVCSRRLPNFQCERTSQWAGILLNSVGIESRLVRVITAGSLSPYYAIGDAGHVMSEVKINGAWTATDFSFNRQWFNLSVADLAAASTIPDWWTIAPAEVSPYNTGVNVRAYNNAYAGGNHGIMDAWTQRIYGVIGIEVGAYCYFYVPSSKTTAYNAYPNKPPNWVPVSDWNTWITTCYNIT